MNVESLQYNQYLKLAKLYLGSEIDYDRPVELADSYRNLRGMVRTAASLDRRLDNPDYLKPSRTKMRGQSLNSGDKTQKIQSVSKLSAFNADKKLARVRLLMDGMSQKLRLPAINP